MLGYTAYLIYKVQDSYANPGEFPQSGGNRFQSEHTWCVGTTASVEVAKKYQYPAVAICAQAHQWGFASIGALQTAAPVSMTAENVTVLVH